LETRTACQGLALGVFMKFIADSMLGKLARWLRIMGYDTSYSSFISDRELIKKGREEKRIILTRDTNLIKCKLVKDYLFIKSENLEEQVRQVTRVAPKPPLSFSRCLLCNQEIKEIKKEKIKNKVPPYVYKTQSKFAWCPQCGRIYWEGTHVERAKKRLAEILQNMG